jgi:hypothetical protein
VPILSKALFRATVTVNIVFARKVNADLLPDKLFMDN